MSEISKHWHRMSKQYGKYIRASAERNFGHAEYMNEKIKLYEKREKKRLKK
ncbi:MAG: hypothetical protein R6V14_01525 [Halanaerobiales bacterium]